jgi:hypothetical protein
VDCFDLILGQRDGSNGVKLAKRLGRIGFLLGSIGPLLFYSVHYESGILCPLCPHVDALMHPLGWLQFGLTAGLIQGVLFALLGFAVGFSISELRT